jgi:hypothetical protein
MDQRGTKTKHHINPFLTQEGILTRVYRQSTQATQVLNWLKIGETRKEEGKQRKEEREAKKLQKELEKLMGETKPNAKSKWSDR